MKRLLTLVLTLALCLPMFMMTSVEVKAAVGDSCNHRECTGTVADDQKIICEACVPSSVPDYQPENESQHMKYYMCACECEACEDIIADYSIEDCTTFKNGYCVDCGNSQPVLPGKCTHAGCQGDATSEDGRCETCVNESLTHEYRSVNYGGHAWYAVFNCGFVFQDGPTEPHRLDSSDTCMTCKEVVSCEHDNYTYGFVYFVHEGYHYKCRLCRGCYSILEGSGVEEPHVIGANGCECGYGASCGSVSGNGTPAPAPSVEEIEEQKAEEMSKEVEAIVKAEEAIPVESFVSAEAISTLPAEVKDTSNTETVYNLSKITTTQGFVAAVEKMVEANKAATSNNAQKAEPVTFFTSNPIAFNTSSLTALADAATEFVYMFNYEGHLYKVTIPAGAKVDLAGQAFAGPLYIGAQLGTSVLVK